MMNTSDRKPSSGDWLQPFAWTDSGHLKIAWPASVAVTGTALPRTCLLASVNQLHKTVYYCHFRRLGRQMSTHFTCCMSTLTFPAVHRWRATSPGIIPCDDSRQWSMHCLQLQY
eukprot:4459215-Pleurochrysis_carterae.AAC.1